MWIRTPNSQYPPGAFYTKLTEDRNDTRLVVATPNDVDVTRISFRYHEYGHRNRRSDDYYFDDGFIISEWREGPQKPLSEGELNDLDLLAHFDELKLQAPSLASSLESCLANLRWATQEEVDQIPVLIAELERDYPWWRL